MKNCMVYIEDDNDFTQKNIIVDKINKKLIKCKDKNLKNSKYMHNTKNKNKKFISGNKIKLRFPKESNINDKENIDNNINNSYSSNDQTKDEKQNLSTQNKTSNKENEKNSSEKSIKFLKDDKINYSEDKEDINDCLNKKIPYNNYKEYNLVKNSFAKLKCSTPIHEFLPYYYKNNEQYKAKLFEFIKDSKKCQEKKEFNKEISVNKTFFKNHSSIIDEESSLRKKFKKIYSPKKLFVSETKFYKTKIINGINKILLNKSKKFDIFFDKDIGFDKKWQKPLEETNKEDDAVESDDETIKKAVKNVYKDIEEGKYDLINHNISLKNSRFLKKIF